MGGTRTFRRAELGGVRRLANLWLLPVAVAVLGGCAPAVSYPPVRVEQRTWSGPAGSAGVQLLTDHFDLRITARDEAIRRYLPGFMETAFEEYRRCKPLESESSGRMVTYLFDTRTEWAAFTVQNYPRQAGTYLHIQSGGYTDFATATSVTHDLGRDRTLSLLAHEGFHQYLAANLQQPVPAWLNEGLACQFEAFDLYEQRPTFTPANNFLRKNHLREALARDATFLPLVQLLNMDAGDALRDRSQPTRSYYAQVWALVLMLRRDRENEHAKGFARLVTDAGTKRLALELQAWRAATPDAGSTGDGEAAFRRYITDDITEFAGRYRTFCERLVR